MLEGDRLPEPPERLPETLGLAREEISVWRLHWEDPLEARSHPAGRFRFDAPGGEYRVIYASGDQLAAFAEVYGDTRVMEESQKDRGLSRITSRQELSLVALDDPGVQKQLGLDGRIGMSRQYPTTQQWSLALHAGFPQAQGIRYLSRHAGEERNYCLFVDRCAEELTLERLGRIGDLREVVLRAADRYHLEVHWQG